MDSTTLLSLVGGHQITHLATAAPGMAPSVASLPATISVDSAAHYQATLPAPTSKPSLSSTTSSLHSALAP